MGKSHLSFRLLNWHHALAPSGRHNTDMALPPRMNDEIGDAKVQVIDRDGANLGIMETAVALRLASEAGLNLVEVAPDAVPAVCKLVQAR